MALKIGKKTNLEFSREKMALKIGEKTNLELSREKMACRIGVTTDPERRKKEWEKEEPTLRNWQKLKTCSSKTEAQKAETELAKEHGCESHPGGAGDENVTWYVYKFEFTK